MWRNTVVRDFVEWLREHNAKLPPVGQVGFYGLDLYSLFSSMQAVLAYLDKVDPEAARRARVRYACFDHAAEDSQAYGYAASFGLKGGCEDEVVQVLREMRRRQAQAPWRPAWRRTRPSMRSRTRAWCATPRRTTGRCSRDACPPGTCATGTWWRHCLRWIATWGQPALRQS